MGLGKVSLVVRIIQYTLCALTIAVDYSRRYLNTRSPLPRFLCEIAENPSGTPLNLIFKLYGNKDKFVLHIVYLMTFFNEACQRTGSTGIVKLFCTQHSTKF